MTEIEKMYKNAGVKKCNRMLPCPFENQCEDCEFNWFPDFTTDKQLDIIKLISKQGQVIIENWEKDNRGFNLTFRADSNLRYITMDCVTRKTVEDALAQIINDIWQDLTDQDKTSIKNILEM